MSAAGVIFSTDGDSGMSDREPSFKEASRSLAWLDCHLVVMGLLAAGISADSLFTKLLLKLEYMVTESKACWIMKAVSSNGLKEAKAKILSNGIAW